MQKPQDRYEHSKQKQTSSDSRFEARNFINDQTHPGNKQSTNRAAKYRENRSILEKEKKQKKTGNEDLTGGRRGGGWDCGRPPDFGNEHRPLAPARDSGKCAAEEGEEEAAKKFGPCAVMGHNVGLHSILKLGLNSI